MKSELEKYNEVILNRFKDMTASQKLNLSLRLYLSACELKKTALHQLQPELTKIEIEERVKEIFFYART